MSESAEDEQASDSDMMTMFASVWVKVEVDETGAEYNNPVDTNMKCNQKRERNKKIFHCNECDYTTAYKNCLSIHVLGHTDSKPLACDTCTYTTRFPSSLKRHILLVHEFKKYNKDELKIFKCSECSYSSHSKYNLYAHKRKHYQLKKFKCQECSYETAYRQSYLKHSKVHNKQEVMFRCDKCPFVTKYEGHISRHLAKIHNEISDKANKCDFCDFSTKTKWRMTVHKQRSRQKSVIKCPHCEFETMYMCENKKHKVEHYNEIYESKDIETTTKETKTDPQVNKVVISNQTAHEKTNNYVLDPNCEAEWRSIQVLETSNPEYPFKCVICKYTARFKASVQRHYQRLHTDQNRPYKCTNCDFSTKTKDQISLHSKRSQSDKLLHCSTETCEFSTYYKCQLIMHQKCHYEHKCNICGYACKTKYDVQKHFAAAHMEKNLKCRFCEYKSSRRDSLSAHETSHTGLKPYRCSQCEYNCMRKALLDKHMIKSHGEVKYDPVVVSDSKIKSKIQSMKVTLGPQDETNETMFLNEQNGCLSDTLPVKPYISNN